MNLLQNIVIALALSADCFAVSVSGGIQTRTTAAAALKFALYFGAAQALMLLAGHAAGMWFKHFFIHMAHLAAFAFLSTAGFRMIGEAFAEKKEKLFRLDHPRLVLSLALATSIDALIVGTGLALVHKSILQTALIAGITAFLTSFAGVFAGGISGIKLKKNAEIAGGLILILIGGRILVEGFF